MIFAPGLKAALLAVVCCFSAVKGAPVVERELSAYDFIVVGGGTGSLITATRLAEAGNKVIVLERGNGSTFLSGGNPTVPWNTTVTAIDVPSLSGSLSKQMPWENCPDTPGAGCFLGGSGSHNALMFVPPAVTDWEHWPEGWQYSSVNSSGAVARINSRNPGQTHGSADGALYDQDMGNIVIKFLNSTGYKQVDAIANPFTKERVWSHPPNNIKNSVRAGPVATYLPFAQTVPDFNLQLRSFVVRILRTGIVNGTSTATGVEYQHEDTGLRDIINLAPGGKIVLGSGTLSTPRVLWNSGIGGLEQLQIVANGTANVTLPPQEDWINLPAVGQHMQDHPIVRLTYTTTSPNNFTAYNFTGSWANPNPVDAALYSEKGEGPLAQAVQRAVFWDTTVGNDNLTRYIQSTVEYSANNSFVVLHYLTHGLTSVGALGMYANGSTYTSVAPWYNTDGDVTAMANWLDKFRAEVKASNGFITESAATINRTSSDLVVNTHTGGAHYIGTARMGTPNNGSFVTDLNTKVYGTSNIYVCDGSFHPSLPVGNTQAIIMMASENAWPKILADW